MTIEDLSSDPQTVSITIFKNSNIKNDGTANGSESLVAKRLDDSAFSRDFNSANLENLFPLKKQKTIVVRSSPSKDASLAYLVLLFS